ncbi:uncharacterized protein LOC127811700 isoform X2 [Diospyros lotus]|uniref:uncharacterized protein LOC127811700 isoform X2 n=1 Tax=Diospyros lotus TaxID=55363 RepID=UPI00224FE203|nr:uncharacterized protein LOC127811700 isoform X2 [Diospyros lotus]XP_052207805.1 uncharacterized protein LOC127811700 isoform X2 [Diospyros lotus]
MGLIPAFNQVFPASEKRYCVRHIYTNFRKNWKGKELKDMLWNCARSSYVQKFTKCMEEVYKKSHEAYEYLNEIPPQHWTRSHFQTHCKCDLLLNNICECFNSYILEARDKGIITCLESIRCKLMKRLWKKRDAMKKIPSPLCPKIQKKLDKIKVLSFNYMSTWSGWSKCQVVGPEGQFVVDTNERSCSCRRWDLTGIPCEHAVNALFMNRNKPENFVDTCYTVESYLKIYNNCINPINGYEMWPMSKEVANLPPLKPNPKKGRRAKLRRLEAEELEKLAATGRVLRRGSIMTCTVCGVKGHNKRYHGKQPTDGDAVQQDNIFNDVTQTKSCASFSVPPVNPTLQNCTSCLM